MRFQDKLKKLPADELWQEYCGFLDLSMEQYMRIQERLLLEQVDLCAGCGLGKKLLGNEPPRTLAEFRRNVPLTTYADYAETLLHQTGEQLPAPPVVWLQTTWESGSHPVKVAPYTEAMLDTYRRNILGATLLATSRERGKFRVRTHERVLYDLAPLPYATGLFPLLTRSEIDMIYMPSLQEAKTLSFSEQNKAGFKQSVCYGMDMLFGMSSILHAVTNNFDAMLHSGRKTAGSVLSATPKMAWRILRAKYRCHMSGAEIHPKDLFQLDALVCMGTDTALFRGELEEAWGCPPFELTGGTETTCIGTETWSRDGMVFFPDACFYEFIPEAEMLRNLDDPDYTPRTYLMNEISASQNYELVVTVLKGGAFLRYRVGDVYRCLRTCNERDGIALPQFAYVDRVPSVIDIAGFTRITERSITDVIRYSRLPVADWFARKEYDSSKRSFMHMFVELSEDAVPDLLVNRQLILEHLSTYFKFYDHDYKDLKRLLGIDPLQVTILPAGSLDRYTARYGRRIRRVNASAQDAIDLLRLADALPEGGAAL